MHIIEHPCIPFATPIYGGFNHNAKVEFHGEPVHGHHGGFTIDFPSMDGIALHMDVRLGKHGEHVVVLNSMRHGNWQCEERFHTHHFHCGRHFHLKIKNHHHHFAIHVNGCHVATFHHREDPHHIRELAISGDVRIDKIHFDHFIGHNGGGVQVGSIGMGPGPLVGVGVSPMVVASPRPPIMVAPPIAPVVVVEEGHHHHHHHGPFHHLFHHHHHHHCD